VKSTGYCYASSQHMQHIGYSLLMSLSSLLLHSTIAGNWIAFSTGMKASLGLENAISSHAFGQLRIRHSLRRIFFLGRKKQAYFHSILKLFYLLYEAFRIGSN
jgi:hypothetical protein